MLKIINVQSAYLEYLYNFDFRVPKEHKNEGANKRPFIGILFNVDKILYFAPLSSPKPKHLKLSNKALDVYKIDEGRLGVINFNNMIPVLPECVINIDVNDLPDTSKEDKQYKNLLIKQIIAINDYENQVKRKGRALYNTVIYKKGNQNLLDRCCDFLKLEQAAKIYK